MTQNERLKHPVLQPHNGSNGPGGPPYTEGDPLLGLNVLVSSEMRRTDISIVQDGVCFISERVSVNCKGVTKTHMLKLSHSRNTC